MEVTQKIKCGVMSDDESGSPNCIMPAEPNLEWSNNNQEKVCRGKQKLRIRV